MHEISTMNGKHDQNVLYIYSQVCLKIYNIKDVILCINSIYTYPI